MLHESQIIEIVMKKETSFGEYKKMIKQSKRKGWNIQAFQIGLHSNGFKKKID